VLHCFELLFLDVDINVFVGPYIYIYIYILLRCILVNANNERLGCIVVYLFVS
jgi:hypothetical protein